MADITRCKVGETEFKLDITYLKEREWGNKAEIDRGFIDIEHKLDIHTV